MDDSSREDRQNEGVGPEAAAAATVIGSMLIATGWARLARRAPAYAPRSPRKEGVAALVVVACITAYFALAVALVASGSRPSGVARPYDLGRMLLQFALLAPALVLLVVALRIRREGARSIGLSRRGTGSALALGVVLALWTALTWGKLAALTDIQGALLYRLGAFAGVALVEELVFRGYLQQRLVAWLGTTGGIVIASAIFALSHIPQNVLVLRVDPTELAISQLATFGHGLALAWVMRSTQHVGAPAILHFAIDSVGVL